MAKTGDVVESSSPSVPPNSVSAETKNTARSRTSSSLSYKHLRNSTRMLGLSCGQFWPNLASAHTAEARMVAFSRMTRL